MSDEILINVNIEGSEEVDKLGKKFEDTGKKVNKTQTEIQKMRKEIRDAKSDLLQAEEGTEAYNKALARAAAAQFKLKDINDKTKLAVADFGQTGRNVAQSVAGLAGGFSVLTGVMGLFGVENENTAKTILKVQSALAIVSGIGQFADSIDNIRDLIGGLRANAQAMNGTLSEMGKNAGEAASSVSDLGKETAVVTSNLAGGAGTASAINDSNKALLEQLDILKQRRNQLNEESLEYNKNADDRVAKIEEEVDKIKEQSKARGKETAEETKRLKELDLELDEIIKKDDTHLKNKLKNSKEISKEEDKINNALKNSTDNLTKSQENLTKASEGSIKSIGKQLLTMGAWVIAISAVVAGVSYLIEKLNEIPEETKMKLKFDEQALKDTEKAREKILEIKHDLDIISGKNDKISLNQLKNIKAVMVEQGIANEKDIKYLSAKELRESEHFSKYLEKVKMVAKEEAIIKGKANAEINAEILNEQQKTILEEVRKRVSTGPNDKYADKFIEDWKKGNISSIRIVQEGLTGLSSEWNNIIDKQEISKKEVALYTNLYTNLQKEQSKNAGGSSKNPFLIDKSKSSGTKKTTTDDSTRSWVKLPTLDNKDEMDKIFNDAEYYIKSRITTFQSGLDELKPKELNVSDLVSIGNGFFTSESMDTMLNDLNKSYEDGNISYEEYLKKRIELLKEFNRQNVIVSKEGIEGIENNDNQHKEDEYKLIEEQYNNELISYDEYLKAKLELQKKYGDTSIKTENDIIRRRAEQAVALINSVADLTNGISELFQSQMDMNNADYEQKKENIENNVKDEKSKNAQLKALDAEYNKNAEKLFNQQKEAKIALAWMDFASGVVGLWSKSAQQLGPIAGPIIAGIETAALLATTIAQTQSIAAQRYTKATSASSSSSSSSSSTSIALTPTQSALTSKEENLNTMNKINSKNSPEQVVKVSDINNVQKTVSVREQNSTY